jgi:hypothetical protein
MAAMQREEEWIIREMGGYEDRWVTSREIGG